MRERERERERERVYEGETFKLPAISHVAIRPKVLGLCLEMQTLWEEREERVERERERERGWNDEDLNIQEPIKTISYSM